MKKISVLGFVLLCSLGSVVSAAVNTGSEPEGIDQLDKRKGTFKTTLVSPEVDFSRYSSIKPSTVALIIRSGGGGDDFNTGRLVTRRQDEPVIPQPAEVVEFKNIIAETLAAELERETNLAVVDDAGPNTLILQPVITDAVFSSSSKNTAEDGRELPELERGTVVFDLIDGETGKIVARFGEKRRCRAPKGAAQPTGLFPNLEHWAKDAAADLCRELQRISG